MNTDVCRDVGWRYFLVFICISTVGGFVSFFYFPDTRGLPLEEIAALFGDVDEVAIYQREIELDPTTQAIVDHHKDGVHNKQLNPESHVEQLQCENNFDQGATA
jgi:hypothetical protein